MPSMVLRVKLAYTSIKLSLVVLERLFFFLYALQTLKSIFYPLKVLTQSVDYQYISTSEAKIKVLILDSDHFMDFN
jgi:hypothetical protein